MSIIAGFVRMLRTYLAVHLLHRLMKINRYLDTRFHSQTLSGPLSAVSRPIAAIKYSLESAWRDLLESVGALKENMGHVRKRRTKCNIYKFHILLVISIFNCFATFQQFCQLLYKQYFHLVLLLNHKLLSQIAYH